MLLYVGTFVCVVQSEETLNLNHVFANKQIRHQTLAACNKLLLRRTESKHCFLFGEKSCIFGFKVLLCVVM